MSHQVSAQAETKVPLSLPCRDASSRAPRCLGSGPAGVLQRILLGAQGAKHWYLQQTQVIASASNLGIPTDGSCFPNVPSTHTLSH